MKNQWLDIKLDEYEKHMSMPSIRQSQYLSEYFGKAVEVNKPKSAALIGSSGGNGLNSINRNLVERIVCVDINPEYLSAARERFTNSFKEIEFVESDITDDRFTFNKVDLIFVGLVFEYVDIDIAIKNLSQLLNENGKLFSILQLHNQDIPEVSPSPYKKLEILNDLFSFVDVELFLEICKKNKLDLISQNKIKLESGKEFVEVELQKL